MSIAAGQYVARATSAKLEKSPKKGTPGVHVTFRLANGGGDVDWVGWLTEKARDRTVESLEYMGFDGTDLETVTKNDVQLVIGPEEYEGDDGKKHTVMRVQFVNSLNRGMDQLDAAEEARIREDLRGLMLGRKANGTKPAAPPPAGGTDFDFGHNQRPVPFAAPK